MAEKAKSPEERIAERELELAAAQRTGDALIARRERAGTMPPTQAELFDAAVRLGHVLEERTREAEAARAEFRALRAHLDQLVRPRARTPRVKRSCARRTTSSRSSGGSSRTSCRSPPTSCARR